MERSPNGWIAQRVYRRVVLTYLSDGISRSKDEVKEYVEATLAPHFNAIDRNEIPDQKFHTTQPRWWRTCRDAIVPITVNESTRIERQILDIDENTNIWRLTEHGRERISEVGVEGLLHELSPRL